MTYAETIRDKVSKNSKVPVRAVIYARVSTDNDGQKESCANQVASANNYIAQHDCIELVDTFIDDGISGKNDFTRPRYTAMLERILQDDIDLIITKSLSRLNRDQYNSLTLKNFLIEQRATILTLEDNQIHDLEDINSELLLSIKSTIDAQFVRQQSIYGKKHQQLRCEKKMLGSRDISYGYIWNKQEKRIEIDADKAAIISWIFEEYVYRNGTPASISAQLERQNIFIHERSIINYIRDERYIGNFYINKWGSDLGTGQKKSKRYMLDKDKWILIKRPDLQIINAELFAMAQKIRRARMNIYSTTDKSKCQAYFRGTHLFSGLVFCPVCNKSYTYDHAGPQRCLPIYRIKKHTGCPNPNYRISEQDLIDITTQALRTVLNDENDILNSIEKLLEECVLASQGSKDEIEKITNTINHKQRQIAVYVDRLGECSLIDSSIKFIESKINTLSEEIDNLKQTLSEKESHKLDDSFVSGQLNNARAALDAMRNFNNLSREEILNYVDRIELLPNGDIDVILKTGNLYTCSMEKSSISNQNHIGKMIMQDARCSWPAAYRRIRRL